MQNNFKVVVSLILCGDRFFPNCERSNGSIGSGKFVEDRSELGEKIGLSSSLIYRRLGLLL